ncbi:biopolymer transport protein ExbD [Celeribacter baekdonensis]|uniref:Biopolymer transport protein ExbD n=1 Tax=Celeribacter baekdonensis TaxID=875171 RepID=A0A1G7HSK5_9RHOB|nr:biopolymer transporter ExbD [Celeribacter baekdonensis]SDF03422.1 biopolymer transport protein ExbD [Celeribacter baekdonensis]
MRRLSTRRTSRTEPTLPLINVVFLMLIFFLVAAQVARPLPSEVTLVRTDDPDVVPPPDALVLMQDGTLMWRGDVTTVEAFVTTTTADTSAPADALRILPDARVPAQTLVALAREIAIAGSGTHVRVMTERALP